MAVYISWKILPEKKALVCSLALFASGLGPICANTLTTMLANPNNLDGSIVVVDGSTTYSFYKQKSYFLSSNKFQSTIH
jgi:hypothetical protein